MIKRASGYLVGHEHRLPFFRPLVVVVKEDLNLRPRLHPDVQERYADLRR